MNKLKGIKITIIMAYFMGLTSGFISIWILPSDILLIIAELSCLAFIFCTVFILLSIKHGRGRI